MKMRSLRRIHRIHIRLWPSATDLFDFVNGVQVPLSIALPLDTIPNKRPRAVATSVSFLTFRDDPQQAGNGGVTVSFSVGHGRNLKYAFNRHAEYQPYIFPPEIDNMADYQRFISLVNAGIHKAGYN